MYAAGSTCVLLIQLPSFAVRVRGVQRWVDARAQLFGGNELRWVVSDDGDGLYRELCLLVRGFISNLTYLRISSLTNLKKKIVCLFLPFFNRKRRVSGRLID